MLGDSYVVLMIKNPPANALDAGDTGSIPVSVRSPRGGHGKPLQYSILKNTIDREAWQAAAYRVAESDMTEVM